MRRRTSQNAQAGFSLVELVVAMAVTLIIAGAVLQLVTAGQSAFRREPELADRQQNIRMGMDIISKDLYGAGYGFPRFAQVFSDNLDGVGPTGPGGNDTDEIEILMASECPPKRVCSSPGTTITTFDPFGACERFPSLVILGTENQWGIFWADAPGKGTSASCTTGGKARNGHAVLPHGKSKFHNPPGGIPWDPEWLLIGQVIRYRINLDAEGTPNLERSAFGGEDLDGQSSWQVIARGVEDLQVEYLNGTGWQDLPGTISCAGACDPPDQAALDSLVQRVRIQLSARALAANLTGESTSAVGNALRGQLITEIAPRMAVATLGQARGDT